MLIDATAEKLQVTFTNKGTMLQGLVGVYELV